MYIYRQHGYVLVTLALELAALLGFAAIAIDVGVLYTAHTAAQRAADSGALAGAYVFNTAGLGATEDQLHAAATRFAIATTTRDSILGAPIRSSEVTVTFPRTDLIRVEIGNHTIPLFFIKALGIDTASIGATAFAEAWQYVTGGKCVKPFFIPNGVFASAIDPTDDGCKTCPEGGGNGSNLLSVRTGANTYAVGSNIVTYIRNQVGPTPIRPTAPSQALSPGNFYSVQLNNDPNQGGGEVFAANVGTCEDGSAVRCGEVYNVKTGAMVGEIQKGLYGGTGDLAVGLMAVPPDAWGGWDSDFVPLFYTSAGTSYDTRQRVLCPIWDICSTICTTADRKLPDNGQNVKIRVIGFAILFITGFQGQAIHAYITGVQPCNNAAVSGTDQLGPLARPLRLVNMP